MVDITTIPVESPLINQGLKEQMQQVFEKLTKNVQLVCLMEPDQDKSMELAGILQVASGLSQKISVRYMTPDEDETISRQLDASMLPVAGFYDEAGNYTGVSFHGVPGGQEFNSFILAIYNCGGPGQEIRSGLLKKIQKLQKKADIKVCVSLACHHCPAVVAACQRLAFLNPNISAAMIDARLYPQLVEAYKIERVPVIIINDTQIIVGPKSIEEMTDIIKRLK